MKYTLLIALIMTGFLLSGQNPLSLGQADDDTLFVGTVENFLLIPDVDDGDPGVDQEISFNVSSSDPDILEISEVVYNAGNTLALIHVQEKGRTGQVTIEVDATDPDGTVSTSFQVFVGPYDNPGINFEIHDIVFWQQFVPIDANPAFSMIAPGGEAPYDQIDLASLQLSVYSDCMDSPPCTGTDFFTALFKGYVIPPTSGAYYFTMIAGDQCSIGLSSDESFDHAEVILFSPQEGRVGTSTASKEWKSKQVSLEAGKTYALYGTQWNIHTLMGGLMWEGPGIPKEYIPGSCLSFVYDVVKPSTPGNLSLVNTGINDLMLSWSEATDDRNLAGYNVYVNGRLVNQEAVWGNSYQLTGLTPGTKYCMVISSLDKAGNESAVSEILSTTTYVSDEIAPNPPTSVEASIISDLSVRLSWSGASDGETEIRGYNLYVDGELYNTSELIYAEEATVLGLSPEASYMVELEAVDAALNVSGKSNPFAFTTLAFDPNDTRISDKKARLMVGMDPVGRSEGLGVNPNYLHGEFLNDPEQIKLIKELEVAALRWGALTANPLNFADFIGTGKEMTFGRMMDFCNEIDAYTVISCGVEDATDWRTSPETFTNFLEYLAGPADSEYGAKRAAEGYKESLLESSRGLVFEFGNEVWGGASHDAQIGSDYTAYGAWCREMATLMRASEYYDAEKIFLTYSGRNPHPNDWSETLHKDLITGDTGEVDWLAVSGYMGGNLDYAPEIDPGDSELDYYKNGILEMQRNVRGLEATMDLVLQASGNFKPSYMYEANMTTSSYFGRLGQAIVQTDYYASVVETGGAIPTLFHLTGGQWKMVVPGQDYKKLPLFYTSQYYNRYCKGNALRTELETSGRIYGSSGSTSDIDPVGCHVYAEGENFGILLLSRDFENDWVVQLDLPDELEVMSPGSVKMFVISGDGFSAKEARVDSTIISLSDSLLVSVPKYSMVVIGFRGSGVSVEDVALGYYDYISASSVEISAYNTEIFDITGREKKILLTRVEPLNVLSDAVIWSVETNGIEVNHGLESYGYVVQGSGSCEGNGTIRVRASAWDNPEIFDEVEIQISNQGSDCGVGQEHLIQKVLRIYPNPARESMFVEGLPPGRQGLIVRDLLGRTCISMKCTDQQMELDLSGLDPGIYYLGITTMGEVINRPFVIE